MKVNVAIIGHGFCGKATEKILQKVSNIERIYIHDPKVEMHEKPITDWSGIEYAFICVPTPLNSDVSPLDFNFDGSSFDMSYINDAVREIPDCVKIVIRSTVGPEALSHRWIHWPEFLREDNWEEDCGNMDIPIILGGEQHDVMALSKWFPDRKNVVITGSKEAATYKLSRNSMLAAKVVMSNFIHDVCKEHDISFLEVSALLRDFGNLGTSHWAVPGPDGKFGFGGSCFPKDVTHFASMKRGGTIFNDVLRSNERYRNPS